MSVYVNVFEMYLTFLVLPIPINPIHSTDADYGTHYVAITYVLLLSDRLRFVMLKG